MEGIRTEKNNSPRLPATETAPEESPAGECPTRGQTKSGKHMSQKVEHGFSSCVSKHEEEVPLENFTHKAKAKDEAPFNYVELIPVGCYKVPVSRPNSEQSDYGQVFTTVREHVMVLTHEGERALEVVKRQRHQGKNRHHLRAKGALKQVVVDNMTNLLESLIFQSGLSKQDSHQILSKLFISHSPDHNVSAPKLASSEDRDSYLVRLMPVRCPQNTPQGSMLS